MLGATLITTSLPTGYSIFRLPLSPIVLQAILDDIAIPKRAIEQTSSGNGGKDEDQALGLRGPLPASTDSTADEQKGEALLLSCFDFMSLFPSPYNASIGL